MADLSVTASSVALISGVNVDVSHYAGEAMTAGMPVYLNSDSRWYKGDANAAGKQNISGVVIVDVAIGTPAVVAGRGCVINSGATLTKGTYYFLSANAGKICPFADVAAGMDSNCVYMAADTANAQVICWASQVTL